MGGGLTAARRRRSRPHSPPETLLAVDKEGMVSCVWLGFPRRGRALPMAPAQLKGATPQPRAPRCGESTGAQLGAAPEAPARCTRTPRDSK
eukprot:6215347-Pyramimonas_sp.AAC.1